jgi:prepilin-type processing-associated H-X9-DG protein
VPITPFLQENTQHEQRIGQFTQAICCLATLTALAAILFPVFQPAIAQAQALGGDRTTVGIQYARQLQQAISGYAQDYDGIFPTFTPTSTFENQVAPYAGGLTNLRKIMRDPLARNTPFALNMTLSGQSSAIVTDPETTELFRDSVTPTDGKTLVMYADGYITRGGKTVLKPEDESLFSGQRLGTGCLMYAQDYDDTLPFLDNYATFKTDTYPYTRSNRIYNLPPTGTIWTLNTSLSGVFLGSIADAANTELMRDPVVRADGKITIVYADGHVVRAAP